MNRRQNLSNVNWIPVNGAECQTSKSFGFAREFTSEGEKLNNTLSFFLLHNSLDVEGEVP